MGTDFRKEIGMTIDQRRDLGFCGAEISGVRVHEASAGVLKSERIFRQGRSRRRRDRIYRGMGKRKADPRIFR